MYTRRRFLGAIGLPAAAAAAGVRVPSPRFSPKALDVARELSSHQGAPSEVARDEAFWARVQQAFTVDRSMVNLNNGGVSPAPSFALDAMKRHLDFANQLPVVNGWRILEPRREGVRQRMARGWIRKRWPSPGTRRRASRSSSSATTSGKATRS